MVPKWHDTWLVFFRNWFNICLPQILFVLFWDVNVFTTLHVQPPHESFEHVLGEYVLKLRYNPRFLHTFCDESFMSVLKGWAKKAPLMRKGRGRESGIMRLSRVRMKTLRWLLPQMKSRRQ